jgi:hypothetical protein
MTETAQPKHPARQPWQSPPARLALVIGVAVAVAVIVWLVVRGGGTATNATTTTSTSTTVAAAQLGPVAATPETLATFAKALKQPIYWAGPVAGDTYEFTQTTSGNVYVRYLPKGVAVGDPRAAFRVIATYPLPDALTKLAAVAGTTGHRLPGGGLVVPTPRYAKSVHMAFPGSAYEIEVFDPVPGQARTIALSGTVRPIR